MRTFRPSSDSFLSTAFVASVIGCALLAGCGSGTALRDGGDAVAGDTGSDDGGTGGAGQAGTGGRGSQGTGGTGGSGGAGTTGTGGTVATDAGAAVDAPVGPPPTTALGLCQAFCLRVSKCDTSRDQQTCVNACTNANAALFPKLRADIVASIANCVAQKDCAMISQDTSLKTCAVEAAAAIPPSAAATAYCSATETAQAQCGASIDKADCLTSTKIYSDATLTEAMACTTKSCSLIFACASATLNAATGSWSVGGGIRPGKRCAGIAVPCSQLGFNMASCVAAGCTYASTCTGTPSCFVGGSMAACQAITGCTWTGTTCTGTPTITCAAQTTPAACSQLLTCFSSGSCTGTVPLCATLGVATCSTRQGCMIQDAL